MNSNTSSSADDDEFVISAEIMVEDGCDYEGTLDEEEGDAEEDEDELADLQKEGDMPLEELLRRYYSNTEEDAALQENTPQQQPTQEEEGSDPFVNQRVTRGLAALNSQYFEGGEMYSSDDDYQPAVEDWRKYGSGENAILIAQISEASQTIEIRDIQIGEDHQAEVQPNICPDQIDNICGTNSKLLWNPEILSPEKVQQYLSIVYKLSENCYQAPEHDDEQALFTLLQTKNLNLALKKHREQETPPVTLWSEEECQNFEQGLRIFGKDFRLIRKNRVPSRSVGELVQFYYLWKKTERHDAFVTQQKLGRKRYSTITDIMGRFIEGNESLYTSRSTSPVTMGNDMPGHTIKEELFSYEQLNERKLSTKPFDRTLNNLNHADTSWKSGPNHVTLSSTN